MSDKTRFPTFARSLPPATKIATYIVAVLDKYNWRKVVLIVSRSNYLPFEDIAICCAPPFATKLAGKSPQRVISEARSTSSLGLFSFLRMFST